MMMAGRQLAVNLFLGLALATSTMAAPEAMRGLQLRALGYGGGDGGDNPCSPQNLGSTCPKVALQPICEERCADIARKRKRRRCQRRCLSARLRACTATQGVGCSKECPEALKAAADKIGPSYKPPRLTICLNGPGAVGVLLPSDNAAYPTYPFAIASSYQSFEPLYEGTCGTREGANDIVGAIRAEAERNGCVLGKGERKDNGHQPADAHVSLVYEGPGAVLTDWGYPGCGPSDPTCVVNLVEDQAMTVTAVQVESIFKPLDDTLQAICSGIPGTIGDIVGHDGCYNSGISEATHAMSLGATAIYQADLKSIVGRVTTSGAFIIDLKEPALIASREHCDPFDLPVPLNQAGEYLSTGGDLIFANADLGLPIRYPIWTSHCGLRIDSVRGLVADLHRGGTGDYPAGRYVAGFKTTADAPGPNGNPPLTHVGYRAEIAVMPCMMSDGTAGRCAPR